MSTDFRPNGRVRAAALGVAAAFVTASCVACSGTEAPQSADEGCTDIAFTVMPFAFDGFTEVGAAYNEAQSDVEIEVRQAPNVLPEYVQQLSTQRLGGSAPDLFMNLDVIAQQLSDSGFSEDLMNWFGKGEGGLAKDDFVGDFLNSYVPLKEPEKVTGLPVSADATVVYYNKEVFDRAGVDYPTDDWTYDEFIALAGEISEIGAGEYYGLQPVPPNTAPPVGVWHAQYQPMIVAHGGFVYDAERNVSGIGEPEAIEAWELLLKPWLEGGVPPYAEISPANFASGGYAMLVAVRGSIPAVKNAWADHWDVVQMPTVNGERPVGGGSYGLGMSSSSECKAEAWDFINWFYSNGGGIDLLQDKGNVVPPTAEGIESGAWRELPAPPENVDAFGEAVADAVIAPALPGGSGAVLNEAVITATQEVLLNGVSIEEAFAKAQETVNAALEAEKK